MSRKKDPNKRIRYKNYSFRCTIGEHDALINLLDGQPENGRSDTIRDMLITAARLPRPPKPKVVDVETLRRELAIAVDEILANIPAITSGDGSTVSTRSVKRQDVNDMGDRIPDF